MLLRNMTYYNLMAVTKKIQDKGYDFDEAVEIARMIFAEYQARPQGINVEERLRRVLPKAEWEADYDGGLT